MKKIIRYNLSDPDHIISAQNLETIVLIKRKKPKPFNANDSTNLQILKEQRPHLYYDRDKGKAKWEKGDGDFAEFLRGTGKLPAFMPCFISK